MKMRKLLLAWLLAAAAVAAVAATIDIISSKNYFEVWNGAVLVGKYPRGGYEVTTNLGKVGIRNANTGALISMYRVPAQYTVNGDTLRTVPGAIDTLALAIYPVPSDAPGYNTAKHYRVTGVDSLDFPAGAYSFLSIHPVSGSVTITTKGIRYTYYSGSHPYPIEWSSRDTLGVDDIRVITGSSTDTAYIIGISQY